MVASPTTCGRRGGSVVEKEAGRSIGMEMGAGRDATHLVENSVRGRGDSMCRREFFGEPKHSLFVAID
jgi:hypothetical protein